jgi:hypothetical protein
MVAFGLVRDIKVLEYGIKVKPFLLCGFPQQILNEIASRIGMDNAPLWNELNETHWSIKRCNLVQALKAAGIRVLAPT